MSDETLAYPVYIAAEIGLTTNEINALKKNGCPFYGRKTCVRWVRAFLERQTGAEFWLGPVAHLPRPPAHQEET
jgi:hypothetical protein